ncbi:hypothetical protein K1T71_013628 [Dendrolimus kikuchii]|uniref:Uncharacterized protein n=1 Tax=Dendrolimus kikuchii TaxID=765133 RepID=A0ACC1CH85_9NEOP|nr:hypothetical protein K1T71_013628 [Dendrolimus kikuchii]
MFRYTITALRNIRPLATSYCNTARTISTNIRIRTFSSSQSLTNLFPSIIQQQSLLNHKRILDISNKICLNQIRTVTKFSLNKGKRKTVKPAILRFFRLHWGGWIRTKIGRHKKMWKKSSNNKRRLRQHVFCNATQNTLLDKMVTKYWKRPKYYVDDPYAPYHTREEFAYTRKKPIVRD